MASIDKKKEKKLKEAEKAYNKWKRAYLSGRISKEELKDKLRPYKYELNELNLVKLKEGDEPSKEGEEGKETEAKKVMKPVSYPPWKKRSSLTVEEIETRVDQLSLGSRPSETLQKLYERRYGEELEAPKDLLVYHIDDEDEEDIEDHHDHFLEEEEEVEPVQTLSTKDQEEAEEGEKKPFWKGILKRKNKGEA